MQETADECSLRPPVNVPPSEEALALVICGPDGPRAVPLSRDHELVIGRHASCQFSLPHPPLSRYHARFSRRAGGVTVEDLGSRHGTWVGGERVERADLSVGASVRLADIVVAVTRNPCVEPIARVSDASSHVPGALYLSRPMREIRGLLHQVAQSDLPVMLLGETGTGKELAARELHMASPRKQGPLRTVNCAAIPASLVESTLFGHERGAFTGADRARAGVFEEARGGTLFLDEIGELSLTVQAALLRVLESRRLTRVGSAREIDVDVRVVSATHRDLHAMVARNEFRADILHRLCVVPIELPPLRSRREEIVPLARHFLVHEGNSKPIDAAALACLERYDWPGNVRELRNVVARASVLALGACIGERDLPEHVRAQSPVAPPLTFRTSAALPAAEREPLRARLKQVEQAELLRALNEAGGNQRRAAQLLGLSLRTFERRLQEMRAG